MAIDVKKSVVLISTIVLVVVAGLVMGILMHKNKESESQHEEGHVVGGMYSHLYYNSGTITSLDTKRKTFVMTVEDINRSYISEDFLEVYYSGKAIFVSGKESDLAKGLSVKVGYLRPLSEYPIHAMGIEVE